MIASLCKVITHFLCRKKIIAQNELEIYQYGFEIIISTIISLVICLTIGIILDISFYSFLFLIIFVPIRSITGGYHADSYLKCNIIFTIVTLFVLGFSKFLWINRGLTFSTNLVTLFVSFIIILIYAPVENKNKPLNKTLKKRNRILSVLATFIIILIDTILYNKFIYFSTIVTLTLVVITLLIVIEKILSERSENHEENHR